ncbi:MAG: hypothetical protein WDN48_05855 [Pseudolabrys sp.]
MTASTILGLFLAATLCLVLLGISFFSRTKPNGRYVNEPLADAQHIHGDGAWIPTKAEYPKSARIRDMDQGQVA